MRKVKKNSSEVLPISKERLTHQEAAAKRLVAAKKLHLGIKLINMMLYLKADNGKLSGRADGNVYFKNGVVRGFVVPSLVQNAYTTAARVALATFSSAWNALTQLQMRTWISARGFFTTNRFAQQVELTGKLLYTTLNRNLNLIGVAPIDVAPVPAAVEQPITLTIATLTAIAISLEFTVSPLTTSTMRVFATRGQTPGTFEPAQSEFRMLPNLTPDTSPINAFTRYVTKFGAPIVGTKIFFKLVAIDETTGQASPGIVESGIVA